MVIGGSYIIKSKNLFFFKYFFQLWKRWKSSGGWAHGRKVLWGMVAFNKSYFFKLNFYDIWNVTGIIQNLIKSIKMNNTYGLIFYPLLGLFSINLLENSHEQTSLILTNTISYSNHKRGDTVFLKNVNIGVVLFGLQMWFCEKIKLAKSAGCYIKIIKKNFNKVFVQLPSTVIYSIPNICMGTVGLSAKKIVRKLTKAGQSWYIFWTPIVRGIAMNPVDHPHGGWTNKGGHPKTPTGFLTKGVKTWKTKLWSKNKIYSPRTKQL